MREGKEGRWEIGKWKYCINNLERKNHFSEREREKMKVAKRIRERERERERVFNTEDKIYKEHEYTNYY